MLDEQPSAEEVLYDFLANSSEEVIAAARAIRRAVAAAAPESFELIGENYAVYDLFSLTGKMGQAFCHIVALPDMSIWVSTEEPNSPIQANFLKAPAS